MPVVLVILAVVARVDRRTLLLSIALVVVTGIQPEAGRRENPVVAAFHPVNALLVFWLAWTVARRDHIVRVADRPPVTATN